MSCCPEEQRSAGWWPGLVVCMFFFWQAFVRDAFCSSKCLESVPFPLHSVSFHCSAASVFAWKPDGMGQLLWPCESRQGMAVVLRGTITCFVKHTRTDMSAGSFLSWTGKQKEAPMGEVEYLITVEWYIRFCWIPGSQFFGFLVTFESTWTMFCLCV